VLDSATAYEGDKTKLVVDLNSESAGLLNKDIKHGDLAESDSVQTFLESAILYPYLTDRIGTNQFGALSIKYTIIAVHSPVSIMVKNKEGQEVGRVNVATEALPPYSLL
jgi:hypothetical protein